MKDLHFYSDALTSLSRPLRDLTGVHFFAFHRYWADGRRIFLCTNASWAAHRAQRHRALARQAPLASHQVAGFVLWDHNPPSSKHDVDLLRSARTDFSIDHGMSLWRSHAQYTDVFVLSTTPHDIAANARYVAERERIERFCAYFYCLADPLLVSAQSLAIAGQRFAPDIEHAKRVARRKTFDAALRQGRVAWLLENAGIHLTKREAACLDGVIAGHSSKEMGARLGISHRTVEQYVGQIFFKTGVHSRTELVELVAPDEA